MYRNIRGLIAEMNRSYGFYLVFTDYLYVFQNKFVCCSAYLK